MRFGVNMDQRGQETIIKKPHSFHHACHRREVARILPRCIGPDFGFIFGLAITEPSTLSGSAPKGRDPKTQRMDSSCLPLKSTYVSGVSFTFREVCTKSAT
jgi:hypothetical protein